MSDTMLILAPLPLKTQCDVIKKIKKLGFKDPDIIVWQYPWKCRYGIIIADTDKSTTLYVSYKEIWEDMRSENETN